MTSPSEIVISGISCRLPSSDNMDELKNNLLNGVDMVKCGKPRMSTELFDLPRMGELTDLSKFDAGFFRVSPAQAKKMDPALRILLEVTYEAIIDSGKDPMKMRNTNTGVYVGTIPSQCHFALSADMDSISGYEMTGSEQCMLANRISNWFDFRGPSVVLNTACSSSLVALDQAVKDVRQGVCSSAIVAGVNVLYHPGISKQLYKLGLLSPTGRCASFDNNADGYCRSEGIVAVVIQKTEAARRIYCTVVHSKVNNNGHTTEGIISPSKEAQCRLLNELYHEAGVDPADVDYIEAHATGTQAGDTVETESIAEVFCRQRSNPLKVGSVKSNLGHTENASGLVSIAKVIIAMETRTIPKNLHYTKPNQKIPQLYNGKLEVVQENTKFEGEYIGINNFGFGGTNAHVLLKRHSMAKQNNLEESTSSLVLYSSRQTHSVKEVMDNLIKYDMYFHLLLNNANLMSGMEKVRAYSTKTETSFKVIDKSCLKRQVWLVFSGMGAQWPYMGKVMMGIGVFRDSIVKSDVTLHQFGIGLLEIIENGTSNDCLINTSVSITAIQIALYDVLSVMGISPDGIVGHSIGELACAYADGCLSAEETLSIAYWRAYHIQNTGLQPGAMAAIGLSWEETEVLVPKGVVLACHNAKDSVTVSGRKDIVETFVNTVLDKGVFVKILNTNNVAFHSEDLKAVEEPFSKSLKEIIKSPRIKTKRWISTIMPESHLDSRDSRCFSEEYLIKSLTSPVFFYEAIRMISEGSIVIEVAPHCLLQPLLRRSLSGSFCIAGLMKRGQTDMSFFWSNLGQCYERGLDFNPQSLDGQASFPVPTGTPMISPFVKWDHSQTWDVPTSNMKLCNIAENSFKYIIDISIGGEYSYMKSHNINGRILFPAAGYLYLTWKSFSKMLGKFFESPHAVKFSGVEFHRAVILNDESTCTYNTDVTDSQTSLAVNILRNTGRFEITENDSLVASGYVFELGKKDMLLLKSKEWDETEQNFDLSRKDVYKEFSLRGYNYREFFQCIEASDFSGQNGLIRWSGNWVSFLDAMLQFPLLYRVKRGVFLPRRIREVLILPNMTATLQINSHTQVKYVSDADTCESPSAVVRGAYYVPIVHQLPDRSPVMASYTFVPYAFGSNATYSQNRKKTAIACESDAKNDNQSSKMQIRTNEYDEDEDLMICVELVLENSPKSINIFEIESKYMIQNVKACVSKYPPHSARYFVSTSNKVQEYKTTQDYNNGNIPLVAASGKVWKDLSCFESSFKLVLVRDAENTGTCIERVLSDDGFVFIQSSEGESKAVAKKYDRIFKYASLSVIYDFSRPGRTTKMLCRKTRLYVISEQPLYRISHCDFNWVDNLKKLVAGIRKKPTGQNLWLVSEETNSGLLGLVKCLRHEEGWDRIRCIVNLSDSPIGRQDHIMNDIFNADLVVNVVSQDGFLGSLRHLPIKCTEKIPITNAHVRIKTSGDLSSLTWTQSRVETDVDNKKQSYTVCYSALNFRDVMIATGKLSPAANPGQHLSPEMMLGMEFSGVDKHGKRVMGLVSDLKGISTSVNTRPDCVWAVPIEWTLEQAATVPMAYLSAYLALVVKGNIAKGETVLIHSGSGGLGQAAIAIALSYGCTIFTTVGSEEKMEFLQFKYPELEKNNIFSSRTTDFEQKIMLATDGEGVDIVLNSLAGELLYASVRVLNSCGRFLEMGKYDLFQNSSLGMQMFLENASFIGVHLDFLISDDTTGRHMKRLNDCFIKGIADGVVKPLNTTVFDKNDVEKAFRLMTQGKHMGKVLIKLRNESEVYPMVYAEPKLHFDSSKWYIITGGLGGIGLELAELLSERGVRLLILTSRNGVRTSYQRRKLSFLRDRGITVIVTTRNIANMNEARNLLQGYRPIGGIFHLAMVLKDGLLQNQDEETFRCAFEAKAQGAINLDLLTRELFELSCDWFVCFSSIVSGRGNVGQANYGYANSVAERVCENRARDGLHGLAVQFGPIAQVGIFHETTSSKKEVYLGAVPQSVASCFSSLETLMNQSNPVVSCFIPEEGNKNIKKLNRSHDLVSTVFRIIGVDEQRQIADNKTLSELGLDSLMSVEVRQILERRKGTTMSLEQVQSMTVQKLKEMSNCK